MTPKEVGVAVAARELAPDWHTRLSPKQLAAYIRYQFIRLHENEHDWDAPAHNRRRTHWDGGKDSYGVNHTPVWTRIANLIRDNHADPGLWVQAHFSPIAVLKAGVQHSGMPEIRPTRLCAGQSLGIYNEYCEQLPAILSQNFEIAGGTLAKQIKATDTFRMEPEDQIFYCICDESTVSASPFFRHAFAAQLDCWRGVERYLWLAALDYEAQQRLYDAAVEPWCVTELLQESVKDIRRHWEHYA
jgi:hypothetical protein